VTAVALAPAMRVPFGGGEGGGGGGTATNNVASVIQTVLAAQLVTRGVLSPESDGGNNTPAAPVTTAKNR